MKNWQKGLFIALGALFLILLAVFISSSASAAADVTGHWDGAISLPGTELKITVNFTNDSTGALAGTIDIPQQGANNLPLGNVSQIENTVQFQIPNIPGAPTFNGTIGTSGDSITGDFSQSGGQYEFHLARLNAVEAAVEKQTLDDKLKNLREYVDSAMKDWKVPGLGLAIVKDGKVIFAEGFGYRKVKDKLPVTSATLFAIGSSTKAFTTMIMGMLVDDGKVEWDKPVRNYIPWFKMKDQFASERMTPRDLVTHRSGLPRHDLVWYNNLTASRKDFVERLQYLEPNKDFRTDFQYQNLMFMTAGYLEEQLTAKSWEDNVRERIFNPLGMTASNFSVLESQKAADYALPYKEEDSVVNEIPFRQITQMGPAGSINSNLNDMAKWVMLHLNNGKVGDKQLVSAAQLTQMHTPYMAISQPQMYEEVSLAGYGLGWFIASYRGHTRVYHGGNIDGFSALVSLYPQDNLGIVVLTNMDGTPVTGIANHRAADLMLGLDPIDWNARNKTTQAQAEEARKKAPPTEMEQVKNTKPSHPLADFAGTYVNPGYGPVKVTFDGRQLSALYNGLQIGLEHWHYDVFRVKLRELADQKLFFNFMTNDKGDIDRVSSVLEPTVAAIVFTRRAADEMRDPKFLTKFVGDYEFPGQTVKFELRGDSILTVTVPGQPTYELEPYKGTEFLLKGVSGFSVEFQVDKSGAVLSATFKQPNGNFTATRKK
ncbi:Beta-lactamase [Candidatus Zixiibacteriota bacterium]|nr:Beta-lactamase [candidate division Zixibacteria bacterium]